MKRRNFILTLAATAATQAQDTIEMWGYENDLAEVRIMAVSGGYIAYARLKSSWYAGFRSIEPDTLLIRAFYKAYRDMGEARMRTFTELPKPTALLLSDFTTAPCVGPDRFGGADRLLQLEAKPEYVELKILRTVGAVKLKA